MGHPREPSPPRSLGCDGEQGQRDQGWAGRCLTLAHPAQEFEGCTLETGKRMGPGPRPSFSERRPGGWEVKGWEVQGLGSGGWKGSGTERQSWGVIRGLGEGQEAGGARGLGVTGRGYIVQESGGPGFMRGSLGEFWGPQRGGGHWSRTAGPKGGGAGGGHRAWKSWPGWQGWGQLWGHKFLMGIPGTGKG